MPLPPIAAAWLLGRLEDAGADAPQMLWLDTASLLAMGVTNAMGAGGKVSL